MEIELSSLVSSLVCLRVSCASSNEVLAGDTDSGALEDGGDRVGALIAEESDGSMGLISWDDLIIDVDTGFRVRTCGRVNGIVCRGGSFGG